MRKLWTTIVVALCLSGCGGSNGSNPDAATGDDAADGNDAATGDDAVTGDDAAHGDDGANGDEGTQDCSLSGVVRTSEQVGLEWLELRFSGAPYPDELVYESLVPGTYYPAGDPGASGPAMELLCGVQSLQLSSLDPDDPALPCLDPAKPDQLCLAGYPVWRDHDHSDASDLGIEVPVVRVEGSVTDGSGLVQSDVAVRFEATYQWGQDPADTLLVYNQSFSDADGEYSLVLLAYPDITYDVTASLSWDDQRPLAAYSGSVAVPGPTTFDIVMPDGSPRCQIQGTIRSSSGTEYHEVLTRWSGTAFGTGDPLYDPDPMNIFSPAPGSYHPLDAPDQQSSHIPVLCGDNSLMLHSSDWPSCDGDPEQICFSYWSFWSDVPVDQASAEGIVIPEVRLSGVVRDSVGVEIAGLRVLVVTEQGMFNNAANWQLTDGGGGYDIPVLPDADWVLTVTIADDHPRIDDLWIPDATDIPMGDEDAVVDITMPDGPERCRLSGNLQTSDGIALERLSLVFRNADWYGMFGWRFDSDTPGLYYRAHNGVTISEIPLVCGVQDLVVESRRSSQAPNCTDRDRWDQPCLDGYTLWSDYDLTTPTGLPTLPVVTVSGTVTLSGTTPFEGVEVEAHNGPLGVSNYAVTAADGSYQLVVIPDATDIYEITFTTPPDVNLGTIAYQELITDHITRDVDFSP